MLFGFIPGANASSNPFLGEIDWFAGNFAPRGWALCNGQLLPIAQNAALFSLLGTMYGGDGRTTFALPDVRGRVLVHVGSGPGLSSRRLGDKAGTEATTVTLNQLPGHNHALMADTTGGDNVKPDDRLISRSGRLNIFTSSPNTDMDSAAITKTGGSQPHNNMQPYVVARCIIALVGLYPSRN